MTWFNANIFIHSPRRVSIENRFNCRCLRSVVLKVLPNLCNFDWHRRKNHWWRWSMSRQRTLPRWFRVSIRNWRIKVIGYEFVTCFVATDVYCCGQSGHCSAGDISQVWLSWPSGVTCVLFRPFTGAICPFIRAICPYLALPIWDSYVICTN